MFRTYIFCETACIFQAWCRNISAMAADCTLLWPLWIGCQYRMMVRGLNDSVIYLRRWKSHRKLTSAPPQWGLFAFQLVDTVDHSTLPTRGRHSFCWLNLVSVMDSFVNQCGWRPPKCHITVSSDWIGSWTCCSRQSLLTWVSPYQNPQTCKKCNSSRDISTTL